MNLRKRVFPPYTGQAALLAVLVKFSLMLIAEPGPIDREVINDWVYLREWETRHPDGDLFDRTSCGAWFGDQPPACSDRAGLDRQHCFDELLAPVTVGLATYGVPIVLLEVWPTELDRAVTLPTRLRTAPRLPD